MTLPLGDALEGKYEILDKIGEGGMGSVYRVRHRLLEEVRVIKVLRAHAAEVDDMQQRFLREARMAIRLKHPNIAQLHDFSIAPDGTAFIVMEFIDGIGLDAMIRSSALPGVDLSLELAVQALAALDYLHEHQFVHRDVSPDNLMLTSSFDGSPLVKLIDLGIAKNLGAEAQLTQTGVFLGKVRYCSPEQFSGQQGDEEVLDRRSDIYSFGILLYELLTGVYPFNGESFAELAGSHLFQPPKPFEDADPDGKIPQGLRKVVLRALEKERDKRFDTAADFSTELATYRNPEIELKQEFDRTVEITASELPRPGEYSKPGSTQGRLDREFGLEKTVPPAPLTKAEPVSGGEPRKDPVQSGDRQPAATARTGPLTPLRVAAAAVVLALAGLSIFLWGTVRGQRERTPDLSAGAVSTFPPATSPLIEATERWSGAPETGEQSGIGFDSLDQLAPPEAEDPAQEGADPTLGEGLDTQEITADQAGGEQEPLVAEPLPEAEPEPRTTTQPVATVELFQPGIGVVAPVLLELPEPEAPADTRISREGVVYSVRVLVDESGKVLTAQIESGPSFKRRLRELALEAAKNAKFEPASKEGIAGRMWTEVRIVFEPK